MNLSSQQVFLSSIDEERFGIRTAKAPNVTLDILPSVIEFCHANNVTLLIARTLTSELPVAQAMERNGFNLMDTLVYYLRDLKKKPIPSMIGDVLIHAIRPGEEEKVKLVAAESFRGYFGHYHADPRLDSTKCDETYVSWAVRSCLSHGVADEVLVADSQGNVIGFATLRLNSPEEGEGVLFAVAPSAQRRGIYRQMLIGGMEWCLSNEATRMILSTQIINVAVQKVWMRVGFEPSHSYYTFHKWFDERTPIIEK
jgi:GNAT superfamily N-acetyltransferase